MHNGRKSHASGTSGRRRKRALVGAVYLAVLFGSLPLARPLATALREANALRLTLGAIFAIAAFVAHRVMTRRLRIAPRVAGLVVCGAAAVYALLFQMVPVVEEIIHFVQYGLAPPVLAYAISPWVARGPARLATVAGLALAAGAADECLQSLLPERVFELHDIGFNAAGAALGLVGLILLERLRARRPAPSHT